MKLSLVIALKNEEDNIVPLIADIHKSLENFSHEIILVDDGATDQTRQRILALNDDAIKLIVFQKNYGQTNVLSAGIEAAIGDDILLP